MEYEFFKLTEFTCKCGCGFNNMQHKFLQMLDHARKIAGVPFKITSGCRCEKHNKHEGGKTTSSHLKGLAADIYVKNANHRFRITKALINAGFTRIGVATTLIHVDCDSSKIGNVMWKYENK